MHQALTGSILSHRKGGTLTGYPIALAGAIYPGPTQEPEYSAAVSVSPTSPLWGTAPIPSALSLVKANFLSWRMCLCYSRICLSLYLSLLTLALLVPESGHSKLAELILGIAILNTPLFCCLGTSLEEGKAPYIYEGGL